MLARNFAGLGGIVGCIVLAIPRCSIGFWKRVGAGIKGHAIGWWLTYSILITIFKAKNSKKQDVIIHRAIFELLTMI